MDGWKTALPGRAGLTSASVPVLGSITELIDFPIIKQYQSEKLKVR
ncbi:hypothetical protein ACFO4N_09945 [Camelliibacillus cellulosilyticus]|uniref:Uncharacterized protein n=1 Tax=Camelliibacillus cellulosilyticus TaxID=2174486 RepID=A0ABV9GM61_9BACL